jgi:hypothetical protein
MYDKIRATWQFSAFALGIFASASAFAWGDAAITAWTARNAALVAAVNQPIEAGAPPDAAGQPVLYNVDSRGFMYKPNADEKAAMSASGKYSEAIEQACSGLTGELIKNGGKNTPVWAQTAQQKFCAGAAALGKAVAEDPADKARCKELSSAISYAQKAKPGEDPQAVIDSAATLVAAAEKLRGTPIVMTQKGKVLGDGSRTFTCK